MSGDGCAFCNPNEWRWRSMTETDLIVSFVSDPHFRVGHCLVIPRRHVEAPHELTAAEGTAIMQELGRLGKLLDKGFGSGIMQKFMPKQQENGTKMNHLHFHVFPRKEAEQNLFPVPKPNSFKGFTFASSEEKEEIAQLAESLR